jgi:hypothetical protein
MKGSDSTNSLTELTSQEPSCFICLEEHQLHNPLVDSKLLRNCGCKFHVHPPCWNEWIKGKSDYDCPICRKDSMLRIKIPPNPVQTIEWVQERNPSIERSYRIGICILASAISGFLIASIVLWG